MSAIKPGIAGFFLIAAVAVFAIALGGEQAAKSNMLLCKHQYALCTSALCIPQPGDPTKAICFCDVQDGASMASVPCSTIQPSTDANGIRTVYSAFSLEQFKEDKKVLKCASGTPWTWCLNKRCTVDPSDPKKAVCVCDVLRTEEWITLGGKCDTGTCTTGYWSGATVKDFNDATAFMVKALNLDHSPVEWCPGAEH
ncbi:MAG TPA: hypothetical protein VIW07_14325 [Candidatus Udaeobacter sp.]